MTMIECLSIESARNTEEERTALYNVHVNRPFEARAHVPGYHVAIRNCKGSMQVKHGLF